MEAEWSIEAGLEDPVIVVPWKDVSGPVSFIDLRSDPSAIEQIPEARAWPEVRRALLLLNAPGTNVWTAKCDAWVLEEEEKQLDFGPVTFGFGAYFDVFSSEKSSFVSLAAVRLQVEAWTKRAQEIRLEDARVDLVIRAASWNEKAGFAVTFYVFGYGEDERQARKNWAHALTPIARLVAGKSEGDTISRRASSSTG